MRPREGCKDFSRWGCTLPVMRLASALLLSLLLVGACAVVTRQEQAPAPPPAYPEVPRQQPPAASPDALTAGPYPPIAAAIPRYEETIRQAWRTCEKQHLSNAH